MASSDEFEVVLDGVHGRVRGTPRPCEWSMDQVASWLDQNGLQVLKDVMSEEHVAGDLLVMFTDPQTVREWLPSVPAGLAYRLIKAVKSLQAAAVQEALRTVEEEKAELEEARRRAEEERAALEDVIRKAAEEKAALEAAIRKAEEEKDAIRKAEEEKEAIRKVEEEKAELDETLRRAEEEKAAAVQEALRTGFERWRRRRPHWRKRFEKRFERWRRRRPHWRKRFEGRRRRRPPWRM
eukprot:TRINITY_DN13852_c0_g1_i8.p1 TRINITY_DN13852_c0_g1~~TRINITY_DN13852_c0_g1_i8.p1  ORF type:complete len:257 (+),score=66.50 TRINITY_DN13852_c0_g1_i8:58-771(+)